MASQNLTGGKRIAVIGAGISGMAAAYYLSRKHTVFLFEKEARLGGHTHTVTVESSRGPLALDTGFIVHNNVTYPNLVKLFSELGVAVQESEMSFGVFSPADGYEYSSRGLSGFFAQRSNLLRPSQYKLLSEILRFNRDAPKLLAERPDERLTLVDYLDRGRYASVFRDRFLYPMAAAIWSMSPDAIREFPATTLVRFFANHQFLQINNQPKWRTVRGGSSTYIPKLTAPYKDRVVTAARITKVGRAESFVTLTFADRPAMQFDDVVFATHGNQVLPLLENPTPAERDVLREFTTSRNEVCLHTDERLLPRRKAARAAWNYILQPPGARAASLTYHMNRLQSITTREQYCVTVNDDGRIHPEKSLRKFVYHHPQFTREAISAQGRWGEISGRQRIHYCGAYWIYGFHEDGLKSAMRVARALGVTC